MLLLTAIRTALSTPFEVEKGFPITFVSTDYIKSVNNGLQAWSNK